MYRAYIKVADPSQPWFGKLSLEVHTRPECEEPVAPVAACFKEVQCAEPGCFRCEVKRGGFRFRWFHPPRLLGFGRNWNSVPMEM